MATGVPTSFTQLSKRVPPIDYTSRDFESISQDMVRTIPFFAPEWTDHNLSDFGIVLQRLTAFVADVLHFYIDRMANEAFLPTAITRRSVANLLRLINYELRGAVPASVDLRFFLQDALPGDLLIPAGTQVQTSADATDAPIIFETTQDAVILANTLEVEPVPAVEGQSIDEDLGLSSGVPRQRFKLSRATPLIDSSLRVFWDEGIGDELWVEVETFIASEPDSKHFTAQRDERDDTVVVFFGDNNQGKIPDPGAVGRAEYRVGGGLLGNVPESTITAINSTITFDGSAVQIDVTNPAQAVGGEDEQDIDSAKTEGPQSLLALNRAVTLLDYKTLAEGFPGVAKAQAFLGGAVVQNGVACCCCVNVVVAPTGGGLPTTQLKQDLADFFDERKMAGTCVKILDPEFLLVDQEGEVTVAPNFDIESVASQVFAAVSDFLGDGSDFVQFGRPIFLSDVFALVDTIPGVDHVDYSTITCRPVVTKELGLDGCEFSRVALGAVAAAETWTVTFTSATDFTVRGTVSGFQLAAGTVGAEYTSDKGQVTFTVTCDAGAPAPGDRASFDTCPKFANVPVGDFQLPQEGDTLLTFVGGSVPARECP